VAIVEHMGKLLVFNSVSLDGFFVDGKGDMSWAHNPNEDPEWDAFVAGNAAGDGVLVFGRITYEMMAGYWPTPIAARNDPDVARGMNALKKVVFSRTLDHVSWNNTRLVKSGLVPEIRKMKAQPAGIAVLGSGSIVSQLAQEGLVDEFQLVVIPVILGTGRTMFEGLGKRLSLARKTERAFRNGNVFLSYEPVA
jgi:dihydrofolate reductase